MGVRDVSARLLDDIRAAPDDDAPRLVWADAVGGERGELVVIQCDLAKGGLATRDAIARKKRQRELLARHGAKWSGVHGYTKRCSFHRGFCDAAEIDIEQFLQHAHEIAEAAPLLSSLTAINLPEQPLERLARLFAHPVFAQLRGLDIHDAARNIATDELRAFREPHGDGAIEVLLEARALRGLRALGIANSGTAATGVRRLIGSHALHELETLWLREYAPDDALISMLQSGGLPALRSLDLDARQNLVDVAAVLPRGLRELRLIGGNDGGLAAIASSAAAPTLERLVVYSTQQIDARVFARFPELCALSVVSPSRAGVAVLASQAMPALRELTLDTFATIDDLRLLAESFGPQLELFDLRKNQPALRYVNELKAKVAGELLVGDGREEPLLRAVPSLQAPWWDHV